MTREDLKEKNPGSANKALALKLCRNVILKDFTVAYGGWFGFLLTAVDNATIDNIKMDTNRDGIDLISNKHIRISNCSINAPGDDAIVLKCDFALNYAKKTLILICGRYAPCSRQRMKWKNCSPALRACMNRDYSRAGGKCLI